MNEITQLLEAAEHVSFEDLKAKYATSIRLLFALIRSVDEQATPKVKKRIYSMYHSLTKIRD